MDTRERRLIAQLTEALREEAGENVENYYAALDEADYYLERTAEEPGDWQGPHADWILQDISRMDVDTRCRFYSKALVLIANDDEAVYEGVDHGVPYKGPPLWEWAARSLGYYLGSRDARRGETDGKLPFQRGAIRALIDGAATAWGHADMDKKRRD